MSSALSATFRSTDITVATEVSSLDEAVDNDEANDGNKNRCTKKLIPCPKWLLNVFYYLLFLCSLVFMIVLGSRVRAYSIAPVGYPGEFCVNNKKCTTGRCNKEHSVCMCSHENYWDDGGGCGYDAWMCRADRLGCVERPACPPNTTVGTGDPRILPPPGAVVPSFGRSIAIDGETAIVGAPRCFTGDDRDHRGGSAYVFRRFGGGPHGTTEWKLEATFRPDHERQRRGGFGVSVDIHGDTAIVGSCGCVPENGGSPPGLAYVYVRDPNDNTWSVRSELAAPDDGVDPATTTRRGGNGFGWSVGLSRNLAVVGEPEGSTAYVFARRTHGGGEWVREDTLRDPRGGDGGGDTGPDRFGLSVAIDATGVRESVLVGAPKRNGARGSAYVYDRPRGSAAPFSEPLELSPPGLPGGSLFGASVALRETKDRNRTLLVVVGAQGDDGGGGGGGENDDNDDEAAGSAYVFGVTGREVLYHQKLTARDDPLEVLYGPAVAEDFADTNPFAWTRNSRSRRFGSSVGISVDDAVGEKIIVGAVPRSSHDEDDNDGGDSLAHVFATVHGSHRWYEETRFRREDGEPEPEPESYLLRTSVAINGSTVLIGSPGNDLVYAPDPLAVCSKVADW